MKCLLVGGNGQVGHELRRSLAPLGELLVTTRDGDLGNNLRGEALDLSRTGDIAPLVERVAPDIVVNAAAYTAVDRAEQERELAFRVNAEAPSALAAACANAGIPLVHYSTDYVFNGRGTRPYREDDPTDPLGVYGQSKRAGEEAIQSAGGDHLILRTAWVYAAHGHNFMRTMLRLAADRDRLRVVDDQVGSPTPAAWIADATARLLSRAAMPRGIVHLTTAGATSWHGFAEAIFEEGVRRGAIARRPHVTPIPTADYPTPAARPAYSVLDTALLASHGIEPPEWRAALPDTLEQAMR